MKQIKMLIPIGGTAFREIDGFLVLPSRSARIGVNERVHEGKARWAVSVSISPEAGALYLSHELKEQLNGAFLWWALATYPTRGAAVRAARLLIDRETGDGLVAELDKAYSRVTFGNVEQQAVLRERCLVLLRTVRGYDN